jgi:hypothetical protein
VPTYPDQVRAAERTAMRKRHRRGRVAGIAALRVAELNREFTDRYGGEILPDDDAGRDDVVLMLNHLARRSGYPLQRIAYWLDHRAPWLIGDERQAVVAAVLANPLRYRADTLAAKIGLTAERRARLCIRTIGAVDQTAAERKEARRLNGVERKRSIRRAAGIPVRPEPNGTSVNALAPWTAEGICRRSWFRRRARRRAVTTAATIQSTPSVL